MRAKGPPAAPGSKDRPATGKGWNIRPRAPVTIPAIAPMAKPAATRPSVAPICTQQFATLGRASTRFRRSGSAAAAGGPRPSRRAPRSPTLSASVTGSAAPSRIERVDRSHAGAACRCEAAAAARSRWFDRALPRPLHLVGILKLASISWSAAALTSTDGLDNAGLLKREACLRRSSPSGHRRSCCTKYRCARSAVRSRPPAASPP